MPKIPIIKEKDFFRYILKYNCELISVKGSHHKISNKLNNKTSIVPIHGSNDLKKGMFAKIIKDLDIDIDEFIEFIKNN